MSNVEKFRKFDSISRFDEHGEEFWSARELAQLMGYTQTNYWQKFKVPLERAIQSAKNANLDVSSAFIQSGEWVPAGDGKTRKEDYHLSRFGAYLVAMNGDPNKPEVAAAQAYFVMMTRVAEIEKLDESFEIQKKLTDRAVNRSLALEQRVSELEEVRKERNELLRALAEVKAEKEALKSKVLDFANSL